MSNAVERPGLAVVEQVAEALVGLLGRPEARELAHRPQPPPVHRRVDAARVGVLAGEPEVALGIPVGEVVPGVEGPHRLPGDGLERRLALGLLRVDLLQPLVGASPGSGLDGHAGESRRAAGAQRRDRPDAYDFRRPIDVESHERPVSAGAQRRRSADRARMPRADCLWRVASRVPLAAAATVAPPIASRLPSFSNRITRHPSCVGDPGQLGVRVDGHRDCRPRAASAGPTRSRSRPTTPPGRCRARSAKRFIGGHLALAVHERLHDPPRQQAVRCDLVPGPDAAVHAEHACQRSRPGRCPRR